MKYLIKYSLFNTFILIKFYIYRIKWEELINIKKLLSWVKKKKKKYIERVTHCADVILYLYEDRIINCVNLLIILWTI